MRAKVGLISLALAPLLFQVPVDTNGPRTNIALINGVAPLMGAGATGTGSPRTTEANDSQLSAGVGATGDSAATVGSTGSLTAKLRLITSQLDTMTTALQLIDDLPNTQGSTTSGQKGALGLGAATASPPSYTTAQSSALSITLQGDLRGASFPVLSIVAASAVTRPANTTVYAALDAVSNSATAGSVTPISWTSADVNDQPLILERIRIDSSDTGVQGKSFRVWSYSSDPTASSGVTGGDNAAFSVKKAGFIGTFVCTFRTFSDGSFCIATPEDGQFILTKPGSGAKTVWALLQTIDGFTPSANSTTFTATMEAQQARAIQ